MFGTLPVWGTAGRSSCKSKARVLRADGRTLVDIATELGVVEVVGVAVGARRLLRAPCPPCAGRPAPASRSTSPSSPRSPSAIASALERIGVLSDDAFLAAGAALYAGEGAKTDGKVTFANTDRGDDRVLLRVVAPVLRVDESRLRVRVYLHEGLDLDAAEQYWSDVTGVPRASSIAPYRAKADPSIRLEQARARLRLRRLLLLADASGDHGPRPGAANLGRHSGVAQSAEQTAVNR